MLKEIPAKNGEMQVPLGPCRWWGLAQAHLTPRTTSSTNWAHYSAPSTDIWTSLGNGICGFSKLLAPWQTSNDAWSIIMTQWSLAFFLLLLQMVFRAWSAASTVCPDVVHRQTVSSMFYTWLHGLLAESLVITCEHNVVPGSEPGLQLALDKYLYNEGIGWSHGSPAEWSPPSSCPVIPGQTSMPVFVPVTITE